MKKVFFRLFFILILVFGLYAFHPLFLHQLGSWLIVSDPLERADVIVVLGGEDGERVRAAVALYKQGYADKLLMSGGPLAWRLSYAQVMKAHAGFLGVPAKDVFMEQGSRSTLENAYFSLPIVRKNNFNKIILVTSPTHTRRAKQVFSKAFSEYGIKVLVYPVPNSKFKVPGWWQRHEDTQQVFREYSSLFYYWLKRY